MQIKISIDSGATKAELERLIGKVSSGLTAGLEEAAQLVQDNAKALCPVDTGALRGSINHSVSGTTAEVGTNVEYGIYQEFGTYKMAAQPYLAPALVNNQAAIVAIIKKHLNI